MPQFVQVVEKLIRGLAMEDSRNMFALFEHNNTIDRAVESRVLVADVLAKFERYVTPVFDHVCDLGVLRYMCFQGHEYIVYLR